MRSLNEEEFDNFKAVVKCNWLACAGGMGLAGNGRCSFDGAWNRADCPKFINEYDFERSSMA